MPTGNAMAAAGEGPTVLLLLPGATCWRVERAGRASFLMENAAYFAALRDALLNARRSILLLGWQFDPRTRLDPAAPAHDRTGEIGFLLRKLARENPNLDVKLLIWRSPLPIAWSQDFFPMRAGAWFKTQAVDFRLDRARPLGACHHQKVVVIDDKLAFCGGGDVSVDRWDTAEHLDHDPRRCTPTGLICQPRHEVMAMVDGAAARALGDLARERWREKTGERLLPVEAEGDPWPEGVKPDLHDVRVGIARTEPAWRGRPGVRENEALHLEAIASARKLIYLENQYVTSPVISAALALRLQEPDGPEVVIVSTARSPSWFDQAAMDGARGALLARLRAADAHGRFSAWTPLTEEGGVVVVHSKVTIVDDRFLRAGSTNLNNRSCGFDTECDVAVEAEREGDATARFIRAFRRRLIGHFVGVSTESYAAAEEVFGGEVAGTIRALDPEGRRLAPLATRPASRVSKLIAYWQLGDPFSPSDAWRPWRRRPLARLVKTAAAQPGEAAPD
ncbi:phospholipase D-like domain-containing protein [Caulobacter sp. 17J80-11]|uniref:phospholipase D-like domain-containing protein n=1 Tax=Caulobacter sp. 17J80-11 TaxID=2763502 RepID=UPI002106A9A6|nr:phospholipase D-like domain-containing protein [Caulobacter sp. 17J80-11]